MADARFFDCLVNANGLVGAPTEADGALFDTCSSIDFNVFKAEWNGGNGVVFTGVCDRLTGTILTDRNAKNGVLFKEMAAGNFPAALRVHNNRDGRGDNETLGDYAGFRIESTAEKSTPDVFVDLIQHPGKDDDGTGLESPKYGVSVDFATHLYARGVIWGVEGALDDTFDSNVRTGDGTLLRTGPRSSFTTEQGPSGYGKRHIAASYETSATDGSSYLQLGEQSPAPSNPAANKARLFLEDDGAGNTMLVWRYNEAAASQVLAEAGLDGRHPRGKVKASGEVSEGSGFSSEKTATGKYKITLTRALATNGVIAVTPWGESPVYAISPSAGKSQFTVWIYDSAGELADSAFGFEIKPV
jgi:hypothetical protein